MAAMCSAEIFGPSPKPSTVYVDNKACVERLDERVSEGNKHFRPKYFYVLEQVKGGTITVERVVSKRNVADIFTKALGNPSFSSHVQYLTVE